MEGIILTESIGGTAPGSSAIEISIAAGDTEVIDTFDGSTCPFITWQVSISDRLSLNNTTRYMNITALHDYEGNVEHSSYAILGVEFDLIISVVSGAPDTNMVLSITNNELIDLEICVIRMNNV